MNGTRPEARATPEMIEAARLKCLEQFGINLNLRRVLEAALEAALRSPLPEVPSGWKLVPLEPNIYMLQAGYVALMQAYKTQVYGEAIFDPAYRAALARAPAPPATEER